MTRIYNLAGGLYPSGKCKIEDDEIRAVGPFYGDVRVILKSGEQLIVSSVHSQELNRIVNQ